MTTMVKPIVFLSHSSRDRDDLGRLKQLLNKRAAGSIDFFLSSDGQSIRLGTNWVVRVSDALDQAKLMFLFLTMDSADSKWIHFEAGHANAKNIRVVPVCLPGMDLGRMTPPLSLLQGFNLHSHEAMSNLARICNEVFELRIDESFTEGDFGAVFAEREKRTHGPLGEYIQTVDAIRAQVRKAVREGELFQPLVELPKVAVETKMGVRFFRERPDSEPRGFEILGCTAQLESSKKEGELRYLLYCDISPRTFDLNATFLDSWRSLGFADCMWRVEVRFSKEIVLEENRAHLTGKLLGTGIEVKPDGNLLFKGSTFTLKYVWGSEDQFPLMVITDVGSLAQLLLAELIAQLFKAEILMLPD